MCACTAYCHVVLAAYVYGRLLDNPLMGCSRCRMIYSAHSSRYVTHISARTRTFRQSRFQVWHVHSRPAVGNACMLTQFDHNTLNVLQVKSHCSCTAQNATQELLFLTFLIHPSKSHTAASKRPGNLTRLGASVPCSTLLGLPWSRRVRGSWTCML